MSRTEKWKKGKIALLKALTVKVGVRAKYNYKGGNVGFYSYKKTIKSWLKGGKLVLSDLRLKIIRSLRKKRNKKINLDLSGLLLKKNMGKKYKVINKRPILKLSNSLDFFSTKKFSRSKLIEIYDSPNPFKKYRVLKGTNRTTHPKLKKLGFISLQASKKAFRSLKFSLGLEKILENLIKSKIKISILSKASYFLNIKLLFNFKYYKYSLNLEKIHRFYSTRYFLKMFLISLSLKNPQILAESVVKDLESTKRHRRALKNIRKIIQTFRPNALIKGIQVAVKGAMDGKRRRKVVMKVGIIPLYTLSENIHYHSMHCLTKLGTLGVKV